MASEIAQPRPRRTPNPEFIRPERTNPAFALPTPSNTPPPTQGSCLTIPELVEHETRFGQSDTLGRALAEVQRHRVGAVLALEKQDEDEYVLSARPFYDGAASRECAQLWAQLDEPEVPEPRPAVIQPVGLAYLTPPSSPEFEATRDNPPAVRAEAVAIPEPLDDIPSFDLDSDSVTVPEPSFEYGPLTDEPLNESLEYLSDYDDFDSYDHDDNDDEVHDDEESDNNAVSPTASRPCSPPPPYPDYPDPRQFAPFPKNITDLTSTLDLGSFSEWPVARGGFGDVWKGALGSKRPIAVKRLTMYADAGEEGARKIMKRTARELSIWSRLHHANVLPLLGTCSFRGGVGIVSEWQENGNATAWVNANPHVDRLELCKDICAGLEYLHRSNVIHSDLRGANVLISPTGAPRLIDFGLASAMGPNPAFSASTTMAGTVRWMAPELQVTEGQGTTAASDMFAFGMTMLEMHTGKPPFADVKNDIAVLLKYQRGERPSRPTPGVVARGPKRRNGKKADVCVSMDDETWDMVQQCWAQDPGDRPCAREVLEWLTRKTRLK